MTVQRRRCPACYRLVRKTMHDQIEGHWDTAGRPCIDGPYYITLSYNPKVAA